VTPPAAPPPGVRLLAPAEGRHADVLTPEALEMVAALHRAFDPVRRECLDARGERQARLAAGDTLDFLPETRGVREGDWTVGPVPADLRDRRVEITGPTDRKMVINALNSGARAFMADFEDSLSPTWDNVVGGQANLIDAVAGTIEHTGPNGRAYRLEDDAATLIVRPRGWHLLDRHVLVDDRPVSASLLDFGLFLHHNARPLLEAGSGPYLYLPKLESHREARLWNDVFVAAQEALGLERGTVKATVLIETLPAAFEMEEILHELREHVVGLNAGRWDYIFSMVKCFAERPEFVLPDRAKVTMTVPFMRAYTELLVATCHRRGAHAMGGMAALIPSRSDAEANDRALKGVSEDKAREAGDGFDGTWVAHPDLVAVAEREFDAVLGERPNQVERRRDDVAVEADDLLDVASAGGAGEVSEAGLHSNVNVGIQYISSWLRGNGAAAIYGLMEDAATAEIARSQVWQWRRHDVAIDGVGPVTSELVRRVEAEELERIRAEVGDDEWFESEGRPGVSREVFEQVALADDFVDFLTIPAYERLD
jgi:malate synthase